ncbi:MAG: sigma-70 family RNA polymerase sigma factor [Candidatus Poribacteria bacterium]|nr:sigma-70 family RNA polymerase sigma factor [Candidatus Poribacteria bacterium]
MESTDFELIQRTLSGDQDAFTVLVYRYQKRVHALAWRKTGDFHVAEEITQDTFLRAYKKLGTLKNPNLFAGWLYVIANRLCNTWLKKKAPDMQSLETVPTVQLEEHLYSEYTAKQREEQASEKRVDLVKRLLQKLPESERIVVTLHYLAGSSVKEISEFLGVSSNTVKSRLYRARQRLQKEEHMVRETLGSFQSSTTLTENIMRTLKETGTQIDPAVPSGSKPFVPWIVASSTLVLVVLMLGLGAQHLARFQQPYSLDATSEMTVDIVDADVLMNLPSDPDAQNQIGNVDAPEKSEGTSPHPNAKLSSSTSGRVVDEAGNPVENIKIAITPVNFVNGGWFIRWDENGKRIDQSKYQAKTDSDGRFAITNTMGGPAQLTLFPHRRSGIRILKVQIADMFFYPHGMTREHGIVFTIPSDKHVKDVQIILEQPRIRGKALNIDGTPIANTEIRFTMETFNGQGSSYGEGAADTDAEGYFVDYLYNTNRDDTTLICWLSATYQEQTVNAKPFFLKPGNQTHNLVFTFGGSPRSSLPIRKEGFTSASFSTNPSTQDVWVINPENGHAYKKILCKNWNEAKTKAAAEGGYLVSINDESEQKWLQTVFRSSSSFIGLNDISQEGQWTWDNGEPLTYINWRTQEPNDSGNTDGDYVILGITGKWEVVNPGNRRWRWLQTAVIEKTEFPVDN